MALILQSGTLILQSKQSREIEIDNQEVLRRVKEYFVHRKRTNVNEDYKLDDVGYWNIISGITQNGGSHLPLETVHGTYAEAIAFAVRQRAFYGELFAGESKQDVKNTLNGFVIKNEPRELPDTGLIKALMEDSP